MDRRELRDRVQKIYSAFESGDTSAYRAAFSDEVVWHVPGNNPVSGTYRGSEEYFGSMVQRMAPLDEWRIEVRDVLTNEKDDAALVEFHVTGLRKGLRVDMDGCHLIRFDSRGLIKEGWGFTADQEALDDFFSA